MHSKKLVIRARNVMVKKKKRKNGYLQKFRYDICCNDPGVSAELIDWCKAKCKGNWGWWFETAPEWHTNWNPEYNTAFMSFSHRKDAFRFWFENLKILSKKENN